MIKTGTGSIYLRELELILQEKLDSEPLGVVSALINCVVREQNLIIMVQYPEPVMPYPKKIFRLLRETLASLEISEYYQILMYLVVVGENRAQLAPTFFESLEPVKSEEIVLNPSEIPSKLLPGEIEKEKPHRLTKQLLLKAVGISVSIGALLTLLYGITRPCVIGKCQLIPQAETLANSANLTVETPLSLAAIQQAQANLANSLTLLSTIPSWSINHFQAETLKKDYQQKLSELAKINQALAWEKQIKDYKQQDISSLKQQQELLKQTISVLTVIPESSNYYQYSQAKIKESQANLAQVNNNIEIEYQAKKNLEKAEEAAKIGEIRASVAESVSNWQQVEATWKTAIARLKTIPKTSSFYPQTQQLLNKYNDNLDLAIKQKKLEKQANEWYNKATNQAKIAKSSENNNDWSQAVANWQEAVNALRKVAKNSSEYKRAQPLINDYGIKLQKASTNLQTSLDIQKICFGSVIVCNYTIKDEVIQIYLTPDYIKEVGEIAQLAQAEKNQETKKDLNIHISSLEQSLRTLSQNAQVPVEVYNSNNVLMVKYLPN